jgi:hypothetical protein
MIKNSLLDDSIVNKSLFDIILVKDPRVDNTLVNVSVA